MHIFNYVRTKRFKQELAICFIASVVTAALAAASVQLHLRLATASLLYVIVIVFVSRVGSFGSSVLSSVVASLCLLYIAPPMYSFRVDDPVDVVAIACFSITSLVVAQLVSTLRRMRDDALATVNRRLLDAEERERRWVARELHDDVDQRLALLSVRLDLLQDGSFSLAPRARHQLREIGEEIAEISDDIRELSYHLHSGKVQFLGIVVAAQHLCRQLSVQSSVEIEMSSDGVPRNLPQDVAGPLFRVLEEALQNAVKHSKSRRVEISLRGTSGWVELSVHDSGIGFDPGTAMKGRGLGVISMQERIKLVKGEFSIVSRANDGTTVHVRVPFNDAEPSVNLAQVLPARIRVGSQS